MVEEAIVIEQTRYEETYFYVEDVSGVSTYFSINRDNYAPEITVYCSYDGLEWELWGRTGSNGSCCITKMVPANGRLYLKAETSSWGMNQKYNRITHNYLRREYGYNVGGNIMSLLYGDDFRGKTRFPSDDSEYTLAYLFSGSSVRSAENLVLPAEHVHKYDYAGMFKGCKDLENAPKLMATSLSHGSFYEMFKECSKLVEAPELFAKTLAGECCAGMFEDCSSLASIKVSFETAPGARYTKNWVKGVAQVGTFTKKCDACWTLTGVNGIPKGWYVLMEENTEQEEEPVVEVRSVGVVEVEDVKSEETTVSTENETYKESVRWQSGYENMYFFLEDVSGKPGYFTINRDKDAPEITVYFSTDGLNWREWGCTGCCNNSCITIMVPAYGRIYLKADTTSWGSKLNYNKITHDYMKKSYGYNVGGNILSLIYGDDFFDKTSFPDEDSSYTLAYLFSGSSVRSAENLVLPVDSVHKFDYAGMFKGCKDLEKAPELMATSLSHGSYYEMFKGCSKLVEAPELPAIILANECYAGMFEDCSSLSYIKAAFETTPGTRYTKDWVRGVADTGTFVKNENAEWNLIGDNGIPYGWTVVGEHMDEPEHEHPEYIDVITEVCVVVDENVPYCGAEPGDNYIDIIIHTGATGDVDPHIYIPIKEFQSIYTAGLGIDISEDKIISLLCKNENGLYVDEFGLGLNLSTHEMGGAMSVEQYDKLEELEPTDRIPESWIDNIF